MPKGAEKRVQAALNTTRAQTPRTQAARASSNAGELQRMYVRGTSGSFICGQAARSQRKFRPKTRPS